VTTIAANLRCMAADSMLSDETDYLEVRKLVRYAGGSILGCAGSLDDADRAVRYFGGECRGKSRPRLSDDFEALLLTPKGLFFVGPSLMLRQVTEGFAAIGTGNQAAIAALRRGWSPKTAVKHACTADKNSRLPVRVMTLTNRTP
jgi:hypothetical protein